MSDLPLEDLRAVDVADVYKSDVLAAHLARDRDDIVFRYAADYLSDRSAPPVARSLPKRSDLVRVPGGAVPPFFAGLLPEGVRLRAVATGARTSEDDHLTLLLAVGLDAIGDVRAVPAGTVPETPPAALAEDRVGEADLAEVFARATSTSSGPLERVALPGVQAKVSAAMASTPIRTTTGPAILKLNPPGDYPCLVQNEDFFLSMAGDCGLPTPVHRLVHDREGRAGLLVARFDRVRGADGTFRRLAQEDACQLLGVYPAAKYRLKTEHVAWTLAETVADGDGSGPLALRRVLELVAFSYLIGNGDLHGKNFSARLGPAGAWEVTPVYDVLSTQPYLSWRDPMALDLYGRANRLVRGHLLEAARRLGLPERAMAPALDRICTGAEAWVDRVAEIGFDERTTDLLAGLLQTRLGELRG
jgi:serine/threonine-protein kinase HipA